MKAIREKCLECSCGSPGEVKQCTVTGCALYKYRFGKDPDSRRELTDEQREALAERMRNIRK